MIYVPGYGNASADLMLVFEAPGEKEEELLQPLVGPTGKITQEMLALAGMPWDETYRTNVIKVRPPGNKISRLKEIGCTVDQFLPQLFEEIAAINPKCILAGGNVALKALTGKTGILKYRGSILYSSAAGIKVVPTIHPANLLKQKSEGEESGIFKYSARAYMQLDFNRAVIESRSRELSLPNRTIQICKDSYSLWKFLDNYKGHRRFALDIETVKAIPVCIAIAPSSDIAISVQLANLDGAGYRIEDHELAEMRIMITEFLQSDREWIGQNWKFDQQKLESVYGIKIKDPYADTMLLGSVVNPEFPKSLGFLTSVYTREPFYKDEGREFILGKDPINNLFNYNGKDACCTFEVYEAMVSDLREYNLESFYFDFVMQLHSFYYELENTGLLVDQIALNELRQKYIALWEIKQAELESLAGFDVNVNSWVQIGNFLTKDLEFPPRPNTGEDTLVQLLGNHAKTEKQKKAISLILEIRRIRKTISTYLSAYPDFDGRMRTSYRISGTETGRSSTSILKPPARPVKGFGQPFQVFTKYGDTGSDIRRMYVADEGYVFLECDASQAEARVVCILSEDPETLKLFDTLDIHKLTASWIYRVAVKDVTPAQRYIGKKVRHAGAYGEGKRRLALDVNSESRRARIDITISEAQGGQILTIFHSRTPKIRAVFHTETQRILQRNNRVLVNPFGRRRQFFDRWGENMFREAYAFTPSSTVADHVKMAGLRIRKRLSKLRFVSEEHDALKALVRDEELMYTAEIFKEEFERPINFEKCSISRKVDLIIPCEMKVGFDYKNLEEYKV